MASKLFDQLDNQEIDSYTTGDYACAGNKCCTADMSRIDLVSKNLLTNCFRNCPKRNDWAENYVK